MHPSPTATRTRTSSRRASLPARLARRAVHRRLRSLETGLLVLREQGAETIFGRPGAPGMSPADLEVHDPRFFLDVVLGGALGAATSYVEGRWSSRDLTAVLRLFARDEDTTRSMEGGAARLRSTLARLVHWTHRNTRRGSRRNIAAHYDLGNELYRLFLDERMMYSCAVFEEGDDLEAASRRKLESICRKLDLGPGMRVLEIGTGWGGFALYAARERGCEVVTTTISREQAHEARRRIDRAGLAERITVLEEDYRDLPERLDGGFDRLVSIEMIEAVGHARLPRFFEVCSALLAPQGRMLLQAIVIADQHYESYRRGVDFIRSHVFPGGHLPSVTALCKAMTAGSDLRLTGLEDLTAHYPPTLRAWRERFEARADRVRALGFDEPFLRLWRYYLCICEAGFLEGRVGDVHMLFDRPSRR